MTESTNTKVTITQIPIVREFKEVFQEILGLPPKREIDLVRHPGDASTIREEERRNAKTLYRL